MTIERVEVPRTIAADAATVFRVLCDPQGHVAIGHIDATIEPSCKEARHARDPRPHGHRRRPPRPLLRAS